MSVIVGKCHSRRYSTVVVNFCSYSSQKPVMTTDRGLNYLPDRETSLLLTFPSLYPSF